MTNGDERERLRHHGDVDAEPGLLDFAVNVRLDRPPLWLRERLAATLDSLGQYPSAAADLRAREAVAARHGRRPDEVLVLAGAAEGFALLPSLRPRLAAVVHPSFTEPELVLRDADVPVTRVMLDPADGYRLDPAAVPPEADVVVLGNPTNPTSVLHPASVIRRLTRPGRVVVVDEAFADAVPGERESLAGQRDSGILVVRSLTKMWGLAGLRSGYLLGDPALLARLAAHRPHWPLSSLTLESVVACSESAALAESEQAAVRFQRDRVALATDLRALPGVHVHEPADAPFLLLRVDGGHRVRTTLRERGIAVRRGETFPGLSTDHLRVTVREPEHNEILVGALSDVLAGREAGVAR